MRDDQSVPERVSRYVARLTNRSSVLCTSEDNRSWGVKIAREGRVLAKGHFLSSCPFCWVFDYPTDADQRFRREGVDHAVCISNLERDGDVVATERLIPKPRAILGDAEQDD